MTKTNHEKLEELIAEWLACAKETGCNAWLDSYKGQHSTIVMLQAIQLLLEEVKELKEKR